MSKKITKPICLVLFSIVAFLFAWNNQSLWIDECCMVMSAAQNNFADVWRSVTDIGGSDTQMACYLYLLHIWIKLTGADTEIMLRLFNIIWVLIAAFFLRKEPKILLLLLISPFFIYYANELRPYIMQIAVSCGFSIFLYKISLGEKLSYNRGFALLFLLCTTSLTSVVWALGFLMAWIILEGRNFWSKKLLIPVVCWCIPFIALGSYYLYTLLLGARATYIKSNAFVNLGASIYELLGLTGLGPSRSQLRLCTQVSDVLGQSGMLWALFGAFVVVSVVLYGFFTWRKQASGRILLAMIALFVIPLAIFTYSSSMMNFRFSGRHFAPLLPLVCIVISLGIKWCQNRLYQSVLSTLFVCLWLVSCVYVRFDENHSREDYRGAIQYCERRKENGDNVILLCSDAGKVYYGWKDYIDPVHWEDCQCVVVSRPEDYAAVVRQIEASNRYHKRKLCPSFWIYELK